MAWIDKELDAALAEQRKGELAQAQKRYRRILAQQPNQPYALHFLGLALHQAGERQEGLSLMRRSVELRPGVAAFHYNLGKALVAERQIDAAIMELTQSVGLNANLHDAWYELGGAYRAQGRLDEALKAFASAARLSPTGAAAGALLYTLWMSPQFAPAQIFAEHRRWAGRFADPLAGTAAAYGNERSRDRRLRVGYVSADFRNHVIGRYIAPILEKHDRVHVEVFAYSNNTKTDAMTDRIRAGVDGWRDVCRLTDEQLCAAIRGDAIDILVDLSSHTSGNRLMAFARRPAPIQVTHLGYPATTGLLAMDYRITDKHLDPPGMTETLHTEKLVRLPGCYWTYPVPENLPEIPALPAAERGTITFGSLNSFGKVTDEVLRLWSRILEAVPQSMLRLHLPGLRENNQPVMARIERSGIALSRVEFADFQPLEKHLQVYQGIDLVLDPFPYPGHTTSLDALFMGAPVVTLCGRTPISRAGASLLNNIGLPELIAENQADYLRIATTLAGDREKLAALRRELRGRFMASPLADLAGAASALERAYRIMWERWCRAESAAAIDL